jgi:hypothetical protein
MGFKMQKLYSRGKSYEASVGFTLTLIGAYGVSNTGVHFRMMPTNGESPCSDNWCIVACVNGGLLGLSVTISGNISHPITVDLNERRHGL